MIPSKCAKCGEDWRTGERARKDASGETVHDRCPVKEHGDEEVDVPTPTLKGKAITKTPKFDSKLEEEYYSLLSKQKAAGEILDFAFKPEKLRLAHGVGDGVWYTPDFRVVHLDRSISFDETKGFMQEAARVRLVVAADQHPYAFRLVRKESGVWVVKPIEEALARKKPKRRSA